MRDIEKSKQIIYCNFENFIQNLNIKQIPQTIKSKHTNQKLYIGEGVPKEEFYRISPIDIPPGHTQFYGALICLPLHFVLHIPLWCAIILRTQGRTRLLIFKPSIRIFQKSWSRDSNPVPERCTTYGLSIHLRKACPMQSRESAGSAFLLKWNSACQRSFCDFFSVAFALV